MGSPRTAEARPNDRFEDFVICTGAFAVSPRSPLDGVWLLDYRPENCMGTVIDRNQAGKILGWAEVDLATEFEVPPKSEVPFPHDDRHHYCWPSGSLHCRGHDREIRRVHDGTRPGDANRRIHPPARHGHVPQRLAAADSLPFEVRGERLRD